MTGVVGVAGGAWLTVMSAFAQVCVGQQYALADWFLFDDGFILDGLSDDPWDRVVVLGGLLMLATLVIDLALIVLPLICLWSYRGLRCLSWGASLLLILSGAAALASWSLIPPRWSEAAAIERTFLAVLGFAGQDTKLLCVPLGLLALVGGILYLRRSKRVARLASA